MKKGIILLILVFCMLVFPIFGVFGLTVVDIGGNWDMNNRSSVVDSNGNIFVMYSNDSNIYVKKSIDNGVTFQSPVLVDDGPSHGDANIVIQSNDYMWIFFWNNTGWDLHYSKSIDGGATWTGGYVKTYSSSDYSINDMAVTVSNNDDIFVIVALRYDGPPTSWSYGYRRFRNATQTWNTWTIYSDSQATFKYDIDACYLNNGSIFIACRTYDNTNSWYRGQCFFLNDDLSVFGSKTFYTPASTSYEVSEVNSLVGVDNNIHLFYTRENGGSAKGVYYQKYDTSQETWGSEESIFYSGTYTSWHLTSSYNVNNGPCVMFVRDNIDTSNEKMFFSYKLPSGLWSTPSMVNVFNDDVMNNPIFLYQRFPNWCILESGYVLVFDNDTTGLIMYSDTGSLTWWNGYDNGEGGDTECTSLNQYQTMGNGFDCPSSPEVVCTHEIYPVRVIEFGNPSGTYTTTIKGLSVYLDSNPANYLENYVAYINGDSIGTADCSYQYGEGYVIQWLCNVELDGEGYVIELYNQIDTTGMTGPFVFWNVRGVDWEGFVGPVQELAYTYAHDYPNSLIDGYLNGGQTKFTTFFKLHHTGFIEPPVTTYNNSIILTDNFEPYHPDYGIPFIDISNEIKTGFFIVSVNNTEYPFYKLKIFYEGSELYTQNYPMNIIKARSTYGFTPLNEGNYSVNITTSGGTNIIGKSFYCEGNAGDLDLVLYTVPNPSERGSDYLAYYDINLNGTYSIGVFSGQTNDLSEGNALQFTELHNALGSIVIQGREGEDFYKLSLFKQYGDEWQIIGPLHIHRVNRIVGENWINVQYWSGVTHITDTNNLRIQGAHTLNSKGVYILDNGNVIRENVEQGFNFKYVLADSELDKPHNFSLRLLINDEWETLAFDIFTPQSVGGGGGGGIDWVNMLPSDWKIIIGVAIITTITIIPLIIAMQMNKHHISVNIPSMVYVAFFFLGLITATILGFIDAWVIFIILLGLVVAFGLAWLVGQKDNKVKEQE